MSNPFHNDDEVLTRLLGEAGDPSVSPNPQYAKTLHATILDRVGPGATVAPGTEGSGKDDVIPRTMQATRPMKRIAQLVVAAIILVALGIPVLWMTVGGGSAGIAFAEVAKALEGLRTATFDELVEVKNPLDGKQNTFHSKSLFMAPSRQRCEMSMLLDPAKEASRSIMIMDLQAMKAIMLLPEQKLATAIDLAKIKKPAGGPSNMFEMVRQLVREGSSGGGEKVESLGKQEIEGRVVVGFRTRNNLAEMTFWADPQTARPVRIDLYMPSYDSRGVMSNFRYDMELDPALFSLEPPAGYSVQKTQATMPAEDDLVDILRLIAQHNNGTFPPTIGMNKEYMKAVQAAAMSESARLIKTPEAQKLMEKLKAQYGKDQTGLMKAWMQEWMKMAGPITQKHMQGVMFYMMLRPENDSHYAGKDVKLGTPDRPIFWYKPTGAEKYRVIYADLSVKELSADEVKTLPEAKC